jgi:hypothetical protein
MRSFYSLQVRELRRDDLKFIGAVNMYQFDCGMHIS